MSIPPKSLPHSFPIIDTDPHFFRVLGYLRPSDYAILAGGTAGAPAIFYSMEYFSPMFLGRAAVSSGLRLSGVVGLTGSFLLAYQRSTLRFWGWTENAREVEMDMKEMVQKVKEKKPLYGESELTPYMQGVAARNSRYSQLAFGVMPWFNFANHNQHGVDTTKYYRAAEKELEEGGRK